MFIKRSLIAFFLVLPLMLDSCVSNMVAKNNQTFNNCQLTSARTSWVSANYEAQYSTLLATCPGGVLRLLLKADWGTTAVDLTFINNKLSITTKPAMLSTGLLEQLIKELLNKLDGAQFPAEITIALPAHNTILEINKLSARDLPEAQAKNLFNPKR